LLGPTMIRQAITKRYLPRLARFVSSRSASSFLQICPLCWLQRHFALALGAVTMNGSDETDTRWTRVSSWHASKSERRSARPATRRRCCWLRSRVQRARRCWIVCAVAVAAARRRRHPRRCCCRSQASSSSAPLLLPQPGGGVVVRALAVAAAGRRRRRCWCSCCCSRAASPSSALFLLPQPVTTTPPSVLLLLQTGVVFHKWKNS
jgi:hypothetical protein